jgi:thiosulfate/3-mercaptopyruvate sulfurtransferase
VYFESILMSILPGPIVSSQWLAANHERVRIVDVRWSIPTGPMKDDYERGHIPGAVFADLDCDLSSPAGTRGRHPLPTPEAFATTRRRLGMDLPVVAYDDRGGSVASRLWWMLDSIGAEAAVLDGGIHSWTGTLAQGTESAAPASVEAVAWPADRFVDGDAVLANISGGAKLVDARSAERFAGRPNPIDSRPGHIPGSSSRPWQNNLDAAGRFRKLDELKAEFARLGLDDETALVASCGSGVTGCHNLLAARLAGLPLSRLYAGSWSEWSQDPDRPVATDQ